MTVSERWERGVPHDPRSTEIAKAVADIDFTQNDDCFGFKFGGDGDNGEMLLYLLDVYFERKDAVP